MANKEMHHLTIGDNTYEIVDETARANAGSGTVKSVSVNGGTAVQPDTNGNVDIETTTPTDAQVGTAVDTWLDEHPEATTTVQDGSITSAKLASDVLTKIEAGGLKFDQVVVEDGESSDTVSIIINKKLGAEGFVALESYDTATGEPITVTKGSRTIIFPVKPNTSISLLSKYYLLTYGWDGSYLRYYFNNAAQTVVLQDDEYYAAISEVNDNNFTYNANMYWQAKTDFWVTSRSVNIENAYVDWSMVKNPSIRYSDIESVSVDSVDGVFLTYDEDYSANVDINLTQGRTDIYHSGETYDTATGEVVALSGASRFDLMFTKPNAQLKITGCDNKAKLCFYTMSRKFIGSVSQSASDNVFIVPEHAFYVGICSDTYTIPASGGLTYYNYVATDYKVNQIYGSFIAQGTSLSELKGIGDASAYAKSEMARYANAQTIKTTNRMRSAIRVATFNTYGTGSAGMRNWVAIKEHLERYGIDIAGFQEVTTPNSQNANGDTFAEAMTSWNLSNFAVIQTEDVPGNCRPVGAIADFTVASMTEVKYTNQSNYGNRHYTKTELQLPRWRDKKMSEALKLSIYNTQLELSATTGVLQAQQLCEAMLADTNPFIICTGDFNDETYAKSVWKVFTDAGFTAVVNTHDSPTAVGSRGWYDNIFVNERVQIVGHDIIPSEFFHFSTSGGDMTLSDHDLVFADVVLDYSNVITLTHRNCDTTVEATKDGVTAVVNSDWCDRRAGHIKITASNPASGYKVSTLSVWDSDFNLPNSGYPTGIVTINDNVVEFDADAILGDFATNATTE